MKLYKVFTAPVQYDPKSRGQLIDILKPFFGKGGGFTDAQRIAQYGLSEHDIQFITDLATADFAILPMSWNYYHQYEKRALANEFVQKAARAGKKVLSWTSGDFGVRIPHFDNLIVLRASGYRSLLPPYHQGMPVFFNDPLKKYYGQEDIFLREKQEKPVIGFCGQAEGSAIKYTLDVCRSLWRNTRYYLGLSPNEPQDLYPSTLRRSRILNTIERDHRLQANFIRHNKYRAGANTPEERQNSTLAFYDNMVQSDYIISVRGGGNFSVRLYETLAMGRIPVFVNTDCLLPLPEKINWEKHVIWAEPGDIPHITQKILEFHEQLSPTDFLSLQQENRKLWKQFLTLGEYFKHQINAL